MVSGPEAADARGPNFEARSNWWNRLDPTRSPAFPISGRTSGFAWTGRRRCARRRHCRSASIRHAPISSTNQPKTGSDPTSQISGHSRMDVSFQLYSARDFTPWDKCAEPPCQNSATPRWKASAAITKMPAAFKALLDANGLVDALRAFLPDGTVRKTISARSSRRRRRSA